VGLNRSHLDLTTTHLTTVRNTDYGENGPVYQPEKSPYITFCQTLPSICGAYQAAPYLLAVALWSTLQLTWTTILLASQAWQVARQMTTLEVSNLGRYGFMGGRGGTSLREQGGAMAALHAHGAPSANRPEHELQADVIDIGAGPGQAGAEEEGLATSDSIGVNESVPFGTSTTRTHSRQPVPLHVSRNPCMALAGGALRYCANGPLLQLLGLDRFTKGAAGRGMRLAEEGGGNPFDMGIVTVSGRAPQTTCPIDTDRYGSLRIVKISGREDRPWISITNSCTRFRMKVIACTFASSLPLVRRSDRYHLSGLRHRTRDSPYRRVRAMFLDNNRPDETSYQLVDSRSPDSRQPV
jgi:hypothetical protein